MEPFQLGRGKGLSFSSIKTLSFPRKEERKRERMKNRRKQNSVHRSKEAGRWVINGGEGETWEQQ